MLQVSILVTHRMLSTPFTICCCIATLTYYKPGEWIHWVLLCESNETIKARLLWYQWGRMHGRQA